jgi:hypothetical protein
MSKTEYETMKKTGRMVEGAGGQTFVSIGGSTAFKGATKGSVYVEFSVPKSSLLKGGQSNWFKVLGPNAKASQRHILQKQGGEFLPEFKDLSKILEFKN